MGQNTKVEYVDDSFSPWHGCSRKSAGCRNCLAPETRVLMADGTWQPIGALKAGDLLFGFDESQSNNRYMHPATVEAAWTTRSATIRVTMASGTTLTASPEHRWLLDSYFRGGAWRETKHLRLGDRIRAAGNPNAPAPDNLEYLAGYLCGATSGDGTFRFNEEWGSDARNDPAMYWRVAVAADDRPLLERLVTALAKFGIDVPVLPFDPGPGRPGHFSSAPGRKPLLKVETRARANLAVIRDLLAEDRDAPAWQAGWLAGFLDTDGSASGSARSNGVIHRWSQTPGRNDYLDRTVRYLDALGFRGVLEPYNQHGQTVRLIAPTVAERIRFVSTVQPALHRKGLERLYGSRLPRDSDEVVALARGPEQDLIDITTSTRTFVAEGLATHNCFAADLERRWGNDDLWRRHGPRRIVSESTWRDPVKWNLAAQAEGRRRRILNGTMCDVFEDHPGVVAARARLFRLIETTPWLLWFPFTKRPELVPGMAPWGDDWPENVGLTTSVENQETADERIPLLQATSARLLCLSVEPLIGPIDFRRHDLSRIGWAIIGGESGAHARPMHPQWARDAHRQLTAAGVPVWFKQHGTWGPADWAVARRPGEPLTDYKARAAKTAATHLYPVDADTSCHRRIPIEQPAWDRDPAGPPADLAPLRRWGKAKAGHLLDGAEIQELPKAAYQTPDRRAA